MEKVERISLTDARTKLGELVNQVRYGGDGIMLTKNGEDVAAIMPVGVMRQRQRERERFFESLRAIQEGFAEIYGELSEEEAEELAVQLVAEVREEKRQEALRQTRTPEETEEPLVPVIA